LWPGAGNDRYDRPVSNLRDAPVGSIGGNLRFGRSHFVSTVLLIGGGTLMLRQNARDTWREAEGLVTGASPTGVWAYRSLRGVCAELAPLARQPHSGGDRITRGYLAHMHPFKTLNKAFTLPRERLKHPCRY
jgi:hypothetical protein